MLNIDIPGFGELKLKYALIDFNGTVAVDGKLIEGIAKPLNELSNDIEVHILTGDGHGTAKSELKDVNCILTIVPSENQGISKQQYLRKLNPKQSLAIGNGRNDGYILSESALGIAILGSEGVAKEAMQGCNLLVPSIFVALELLKDPSRLRATLRA